MNFDRSKTASRPAWLPATVLAATALLAQGAMAQPQGLNYGEALATYKDQATAGVKLQDGVFPGVSAKASINRAISRDSVINQSALLQPDGTLKLPDNQQNLVIRSTVTDVQRDANGTVRVASPTIQGNVTGNVTLFVDGQGIKNITVLNNPP